MRVPVRSAARLSAALRPFDALRQSPRFHCLLAVAGFAAVPGGAAAMVSAQDTTSAAVPAVRAFIDSDTTVTGARRVAGFEVRNTSGTDETVALACFVEGPVDACTIAAPTLSLAAGEAAQVVVRYETGASAGHGRLVLRASTSAGSPTAATDVVVTARPDASGKSAQQSIMMAPGGIEVWFQHASVMAEPNMPDGIETLFVENTNSQPDNVSLSCTRTGAVTGCAVVPSSVFLDAYEQIDVSVTFTTGASGTGTIIAIGGGSRDTLAVTIQSAGSPGAPIVTSSNLSPGRLQERSACVTSGAGPAAAFQCGELLVAHAMPAYRTMNRERSLTLLYNSATAQPAPVILADISLGAQTAVPQSVNVKLWTGTTLRKDVTYSVSGLSSGGAARRIAIPFDASTVATGIYPYSLTVRNQYASSWYETTVTGEVIVVNRMSSPFGAGWWVAGVERIVTPTGTLASGRLLVGADGSAAYYSSIGANKWLAPAGAYRDELVSGSFTTPAGTSTYRRILLNGTEIHYDGGGRQIWVEDRDGNGVSYGWAAGDSLSFIRISPYWQHQNYWFAYESATKKLNYVLDPAGRVLQATVTGSNLTLLQDPGAPSGKEVRFGYSGSRMTWRRSAEGDTTKYAYHAGTSLLATTTLPATAAGTGIITYAPARSRGLALTTSGNLTYPSASVLTDINGPRTDVSDVSHFYENRYGAPVHIRDAALQHTYIRYHALHPLLVDSVHYPNGRWIRMTYDASARLTMTEDPQHSSGSPAVARYAFVPTSTAPESPDTVFLPGNGGAADRIRFTYSNGRLTQITDARGHITAYTYNTAGQVETVTEQSVAYWSGGSDTTGHLVSRIAYNALGNPDSVWTPMSHLTTYVYDSYGNTSRVRNAVGDIIDYHHTPMNLQDSIIQYDAAGSYRTSIAYDYDGNRTSLCDPRHICRDWYYDALGRVLSMTDEFGRVEVHRYDRAGNLTTFRNRQNDSTLTMFDAMNRPTKRILGRIRVDSNETGVYAEPIGTILIPADTLDFQYDSMGRLQRAENAVAITWRDYTKEGAISRDSQQVKITSPATKHTLRYTYHPSGARKTMQTPQRTYTYTYSAGGLLAAITWAGGERVDFGHDALGRIDTLRTSGASGVVSATTAYRFDQDGRAARVITKRPAGAVLVDVEYALRDALGRPLSVIDRSARYGGSILTKALAYDGRGHMIRDQASGVTGQSHILHYGYDASGNRTYLDSGCTTAPCSDSTRYTYGISFGLPTNRLVTVRHWTPAAFQMHEYAYDFNGNMWQDNWTRSDGQEWALRRYYNAAERLQEWQPTSASEDLHYLYDALGRRQRGALFGDSINLFFYDGQNVIAQGATQFLPGPGVDQPLVAFFPQSVNCPLGSSRRGYFTTLGNRLLDFYGEAGTQSCVVPGLAWGAAQHAGAIAGSESFALERSPTGDGLSFFRNRFYDANMGRFTQEDPIGFAGGLNLYAYAGNNPAFYTDPFGLCPETGDEFECFELPAIQVSVARQAFSTEDPCASYEGGGGAAVVRGICRRVHSPELSDPDNTCTARCLEERWELHTIKPNWLDYLIAGHEECYANCGYTLPEFLLDFVTASGARGRPEGWGERGGRCIAAYLPPTACTYQ